MEVYWRDGGAWPDYLQRRSTMGAGEFGVAFGVSFPYPSTQSPAPSPQSLADGIAGLGAAFDIAMGQELWKLQMRRGGLKQLLNDLRTSEFEQGAQPFRERAEEAYLNGWYQEALSDFLEAEKRNYRDFSVLRAIANTYLYETFDYPSAVKYYTRCAKYAAAYTKIYAAEAMMFAAWTHYLLRNDDAAIACARNAFEMNPGLSEAYYLHAKFAAVAGRTEPVVPSLENAIRADRNYWTRVENDPDFTRLHSETNLHNLLRDNARARANDILNPRRILQDYYIVPHRETQQLVEQLYEAQDLSERASTYLDYLGLIPKLKGCRQMLDKLKDFGELAILTGHKGWIRSIDFSPDGKLLVSVSSASSDPSIRIWDVAERKQTMEIEQETNDITSVVFSPDGNLLATAAGDHLIRLWDVKTGRKVAQLEGHTDWVRSVVFSPDGKMLASASEDKTVRLWNVAAKRQIAQLGGNQEDVLRFWDVDSVFSVVFNPSGNILAGGARDHTVRLWNAATKKQIARFEGHTGWVHTVAFSPDGRLLASGARDSTVWLWDVVATKQLAQLKGHTDWVHAVAFSPDGRILASASEDKTIRLWDAATQTQLAVLEGHKDWVHALDFSPEGNLLASGSGDCTIRLWQVNLVITETERVEQEHRRQAEEARRRRGELEALRNEILEVRQKLNQTISEEKEKYVTLELKTAQEMLVQAETALSQEDIQATRTLADRARLETTKLKALIQSRMEEEHMVEIRRQSGQCIVCSRKLRFLDKLGGHEKCKMHR